MFGAASHFTTCGEESCCGGKPYLEPGHKPGNAMLKNLLIAVVVAVAAAGNVSAQAKKKVTLDDVAKALEATNKKLDGLEKKLDDFQDENRDAFKKLNNRMDAFDARLGNIEVTLVDMRNEMKALGIAIKATDEKAEKALSMLGIVLARMDKADAERAAILANQDKAASERSQILQNQAFLKGQISVLKERPACVPATVVVNNNPAQCQAQCVRPILRTVAIPYGWSWRRAEAGGAYRIHRCPLTGRVSWDWYEASSSTEVIVY